MIASRQIPPVRSRRVLVNQPFLYEAVLGVRSQEAQFTFMATQQAANDTRQRVERYDEEAIKTSGNAPMLLAVLALLIAIGAGGAALAVWLAPYLLTALGFFEDNPIATGFGLTGVFCVVLFAKFGAGFLFGEDA